MCQYFLWLRENIGKTPNLSPFFFFPSTEWRIAANKD